MLHILTSCLQVYLATLGGNALTIVWSAAPVLSHFLVYMGFQGRTPPHPASLAVILQGLAGGPPGSVSGPHSFPHLNGNGRPHRCSESSTSAAFDQVCQSSSCQLHLPSFPYRGLCLGLLFVQLLAIVENCFENYPQSYSGACILNGGARTSGLSAAILI